MSFDYSQTADSTFGIGWSESFAKHYSAGGSFTVSNSLGSDGGFTAGPGFNRFVFGHFYRQRYKSTNVLCSTYEVKYVKAAGDAFPASKTAKAPGRDPYGRCGSDPFGLDQMAPDGGHFNSDRAHATTYSAAATIFDLKVSGSTGYTDGIHIAYKNNSSRTEFVCGNDLMPNAPKLWSNNDRGR